MIFETERLILRPWTENDAKDLYKYAKDPDIALNSGWMPHKSVEESLEILKTILSEPENYAICLKSDNVAIGCIALINRDGKLYTDEKHELEIGYWIGKPFWGMGLVPEAVYRMQQRAFFDLDCTALWCGYYEGNERSHRVMEKSGFRYHHTEKDIFVEPLNDTRTEILTYLTKEEWEEFFRNK